MARILVSFFNEPVLDMAATEAAGRDIYRDELCIRKIVAGSPDVIVNRATEEDKREHPEAWNRFQTAQKGREELNGTPLAEWAQASASLVRTLASWNVFTVEDFAMMDDNDIMNLGMGMRKKQQQAIAFINDAMNGAERDKLAADNEAMKSKIDALEKQIAAMQSKPKTVAKKDEEAAA